MALDSSGTRIEQGEPPARHTRRRSRDVAGARLAGLPWRILSVVGSAADRIGRPVSAAFKSAWTALGKSAVGRIASVSLMRRIVISNLLGLVILFGGAMYLSQFNIWLIDSKRESLQVRALTIASALSSNTSVEAGSAVGTQGGSGGSKVNDITEENPFAELMFSLDPVKVTQMLRRLLADIRNRARVYDLNGDLIYDSNYANRPDKQPKTDQGENPNEKPQTRNLLTRMTQRLLGSDLRVYSDLKGVNGRAISEIRHAFKGKTSAFMMLTKKGRQVVSIATPIERAGTVQGVLLLSTHRKELDDLTDEQRLVILGFAFVALLAAIIASYLLARTVADPMQELSEVAEDVTRNIHSAANFPKFDDREDEVGQLTRAFKAMTASLYGRIEASEKFAADVAHELKNPLAAARSTAQAFDYAKTDEQREMLVKQIQVEIARLSMLITDVSNASRLDAELLLQQTEPVDLAAIAEEIVISFRDLLSDSDRNIRLHFDPAERVAGAYVVSGHAGRLGQVITNLVDNALSFSPDDGTVDISLRSEDGIVVLSVEDEGPGIDPEQLEAVFKRFYTYRPTADSSRGNNSGLGLSISREIIHAHDGTIQAGNRPPGAGHTTGTRQRETPETDTLASGGARFTVRLRTAAATAAANQPRRRLRHLMSRGRARPNDTSPT